MLSICHYLKLSCLFIYCLFSFLFLKIVLQSSGTNLYPIWKIYISVNLHPLQHLAKVGVLKFGQSYVGKIIFHCGLDLYFPGEQWYWTSICLLVFCVSSCPFIYLLGCLGLVINCRSFYMFLVSVLFPCVYFEYLVSIL